MATREDIDKIIEDITTTIEQYPREDHDIYWLLVRGVLKITFGSIIGGKDLMAHQATLMNEVGRKLLAFGDKPQGPSMN